MPRMPKCRRVCAEPQARMFTPECEAQGCVTLSVEELESLRLCDLEALDQDAAAGRMEVSRGTLQRILYAARHKTAEALVQGRALKIEGGHYAVQGQPGGCAAGCQYCRFCQIVPDKGEHTHESNT